MNKEYKNAVPSELCKKIIKFYEDNTAQHVARDTITYNFSELLVQNTEIEDEVYAIAEKISEKYQNDHNINFFPKHYGFEQLRIKKYDSNTKDEFDWHVDVGDYASARRFLICMIYLNDDFEGGHTEFGNLVADTEIIPEEGKIAVFTPFWDNPHRGCPVTKGAKYILNIYLHYL